jgi:hypothetical protein
VWRNVHEANRITIVITASARFRCGSIGLRHMDYGLHSQPDEHHVSPGRAPVASHVAFYEGLPVRVLHLLRACRSARRRALTGVLWTCTQHQVLAAQLAFIVLQYHSRQRSGRHDLRDAGPVAFEHMLSRNIQCPSHVRATCVLAYEIEQSGSGGITFQCTKAGDTPGTTDASLHAEFRQQRPCCE